MSVEWVSIYCPFCNQRTSLKEAPVYYNDPDYTGYGGGKIKNAKAKWQKNANESWWIGICNFCREPVLVLNDGEKIYPAPLPSPTDSRIPPEVRNDLDEAKKCFSVGAYRASAVMSRRAIQSACIAKGVANKRLVDQLSEMASKGIITKDLKDLADTVRWVGNDAAHPDSQEVTKQDAKEILHLAEEFLKVIFVAPAIVQEQKKKRGK